MVQQELGLSEEQQKKLLARREAIRSHREHLRQADNRLTQLRERAESHLDAMSAETDRLLSLLTPIQLAKYILWVDQNQWCMEMLDTMFSQEGM